MSKINYNNLTKEISKLILEKKGVEIEIINVSKLTSLTDYFILCTSDSNPKTKALTNHIIDGVNKKYNIKPLHSEGIENLDWVLLDYINIVVNIFKKDKRDYYNIKRLWGDAKIIKIKESFEEK